MEKHHDIEINALHTLENFCDAYEDEHSIVVMEAMANTIDAKADMVNITLKNKSITFRDNGPGMNRKQFTKYHKISGSTKIKGRGIGFAGVGAKVYLAVWKNTIIHTETYGDDGAFESNMYVKHGRPKWDELDASTTSRVRGTSYGVTLRDNDYKRLQDKIEDIIRDQFNFAMLNKLTVYINDVKLEPWNPQHKFQTHGIVKVNGISFPVTLTVMSDDIPAKYRCLQYQVWGKTITTKKLDWIADVLEPYKNRIHVAIDAEKCSKYLKLSKNSFKSGHGPVSEMYKHVEKWVHETLRKHGYVETQLGEVQRSAKLSNFFQKLFKNPEYEWLNPNVRNGSRSGGGTGIKILTPVINELDNESEETTEGDKSEETAKDNENSKRVGRGLSITFTDRVGDKRDGWLDPENNNFVCNTQHPLYSKYPKNEEARNQRVKSIIFSSLIKNGGDNKNSMSLADVFDLHRDLMTEAKDLKVV